MKPVILNVDDYEAGRYASSRVLRQAGFAVVEAATGADALKLALQRPDLIVLDVHLPDMDGFEVCRQLKRDRRTAQIPVLQMSAAYRGAGDRARGLEGGADAYLAQPVEPRELVATVHSLLRDHPVTDAARRSERRFASPLQALAAAALAISRTASPEEVLRVLTDEARRLIGARHAVARLGAGVAERAPPRRRTPASCRPPICPRPSWWCRCGRATAAS